MLVIVMAFIKATNHLVKTAALSIQPTGNSNLRLGFIAHTHKDTQTPNQNFKKATSSQWKLLMHNLLLEVYFKMEIIIHSQSNNCHKAIVYVSYHLHTQIIWDGNIFGHP